MDCLPLRGRGVDHRHDVVTQKLAAMAGSTQEVEIDRRGIVACAWVQNDEYREFLGPAGQIGLLVIVVNRGFTGAAAQRGEQYQGTHLRIHRGWSSFPELWVPRTSISFEVVSRARSYLHLSHNQRQAPAVTHGYFEE